LHLHHPHHVLRPIGWDDARSAELAALGDPSLRPARCARVDRGGLIALAPEGPVALRRSVPLAAGDWLALSGETIAHVLPRRGTVSRRAPGRAAGEQAIAANVDVLVAVLGFDRPLRFGRLRRALALAAQGGTAAAVALTKADLAEDPDGVRRAVAAAAPGVPVLVVGAREGAGVAEVAALAGPDRTIALLGESGAGKTTLTNALTGIDRATGAVRAGDAKGRHVTTARELLPLPGGGAIVDTPGLRELGVAAGALDALRREAEALERRMDVREHRRAERRFGRQAREAVRERRRRRGDA
jgi:ribosome biogenesis GTPase